MSSTAPAIEDDRGTLPAMNVIDVIVPTIRWDDHVRGLLGYLSGNANSRPGRVSLYIGDNSCNPEKHAFLETLRTDQVHVFKHATNLGMHGNHADLLNRSSAEYVQSVGDDDWIHSDWLDNAGLLQRDPAVIAAAGPKLQCAAVEPGSNAIALW